MSTSLALRFSHYATLRSTRCVVATGLRNLHATSRRAEYYPTVNPERFSELTGASGRLVLVDVYADWCQPCKVLAPVLEKLSTDATVKSGSGLPLDVVKIDADDETFGVIVRQLKVRALPTVIAFRDGEVIDQFIGAINEDAVGEFLQKV